MTTKLELNIDGNLFIQKKDILYLNNVKCTDEEEINFLKCLVDATKNLDGTFNESVFYDKFNIVNLNNISDNLHNINIIESPKGRMVVKTLWGGDSVNDIKNELELGYKGSEPLSMRESLKSWCDHHIDSNYVIMTKKELINFIKERKNNQFFLHSSLCKKINNDY